MQNLIHAELSLLGSIILYPHKIPVIFSKLSPDDFISLENKVIFRAMKDLESQGKDISPVAIAEVLKAKDVFEEVGYNYILDLGDYAPASSGNVDSILEIVLLNKMKANVSKLADSFIKAVQESFTKEQVSDQVNQVISNLFDVGRSSEKRLQHTREVLEELSSSYQLLKDGKFDEARKNYISTGFASLDSLIGGGINSEEDFIILAARPAMGKSGFLKDLVLNFTEKITNPILYISLEMSNRSVVNRMVVSTSEVDNYRLSSGYKVDWSRVDSAIDRLKSRDIYFVDLGSLKVSEIVAYKNQIESETGKKLGAVVIDYLQLMDSENSDNRVQEVSKISRGLKRFVQDFKIPVIALSQLSRSVEQRSDKRPMLSDLRESGSLEQDASQVWFIYRPEYYDPNTDRKRIAELIVAKGRNSAIGTVELYYESTLVKFTGLEK